LNYLKNQKKYGIGFVGLRRKDNSGTVVINLDKDGLIYWSLKVAGEKGMHKIGEGHGILYMQILNEQKKLMSSVGHPALPLKNNDFNFEEILAGKVKVVSRKVDVGNNKILDVAAPLFLDKKSWALSESASIVLPWIKALLKTDSIFLFFCFSSLV